MPVTDLTPNSSTETTAWGANPHLAIDDPPDSPDDSGSTTASASTTGLCRYRVGLSAMPNMISASKATLRTRLIGMVGQGAGVTAKPYVYVNSVRYYGPTITAPEALAYTTHLTEWITNPNTLLAWTKADLDALECGVEYQPTSDAEDILTVTQQSVRVEYVAASQLIGAAVDVGSRRLWLIRNLLQTIRGKMPGWVVDQELFQAATWSHRAGPSTADGGWTLDWDKRGFGITYAQETDLDDPAWATVIEAIDARHFWVMDWDPMISEEAPGTGRPGIPSINAGAARTFTRASKAYVYNAAAKAQGIDQLVEVATDVEKTAALGTLIEGQVTKDQLHASGVSGVTTGWTTAGTGSNGSAIATATNIVLWHTDIVPHSIKFTAGSPIHTADLERISSNAITVTNGQVRVFAFDHYDVGGQLWYAIQRADTANWWRDSDQTWQGTKTWNAMTLSSNAWHRHVTKVITMNANTTLTLRTGIPTTGGVAGQVNYQAQAESEPQRWASSHVVTTTATVTCSSDTLKLENNDGKRVWPHVQGTTGIWCRPLWNSADRTSGNFRLLMAYFDANNFEQLLYAAGSARFEFSRRVGGVTYTAFYAIALTRGTLYKLRLRRTGPKAEHGLAAYTLSIFVNGVKGTDAVSAAFGSLPADPLYLWIGQDETGANHWDGYLEQRESRPMVWTDDEVAGADG
jgi:hypothetical protein